MVHPWLLLAFEKWINRCVFSLYFFSCLSAFQMNKLKSKNKKTLFFKRKKKRKQNKTPQMLQPFWQCQFILITKLLYDSAVPLLGTYSRGVTIYTHTKMQEWLPSSSFSYGTPPSQDTNQYKGWGNCVLEYYSAIKMSWELVLTSACVGSRGIVISERWQTPKRWCCCVILLISDGRKQLLRAEWEDRAVCKRAQGSVGVKSMVCISAVMGIMGV